MVVEDVKLGVMVMLGVALAMPSKLVMPRFTRSSPTSADIASGMFWKFSSRFSAVTITS
jgi:hypothetical protein